MGFMACSRFRVLIRVLGSGLGQEAEEHLDPSIDDRKFLKASRMAQGGGSSYITEIQPPKHRRMRGRTKPCISEEAG